jgi:hypothetical protein
MNDQGLSVTINAAKSSLPAGSTTPVSLVTREILQCAKNIKEAIAIAKSGKCLYRILPRSFCRISTVIIEKTPDDLDVYDPQKDFILCTITFRVMVWVKQK